MEERVHIFTYQSGSGATVIESRLEDEINDWLARTGGKLVSVTQSESQRQQAAHITISIWYRPAKHGERHRE